MTASVSRGPCYSSAFARRMTRASMDPRFIDDLAKRLSAAIPPGITAIGRDLEDNFKAILQAGLTRLDLVSRQEFDVQSAVLRRTREKLEALEKRLDEYEKTRNLQGGEVNSG
jgi:BMFP domain-containing protein YqiC